ncbi:hypothetical protein P872_12440 [Rhodonellum psychrophilum GCM71 = DSM 17998]|uniref:histidine kinase n=2 Tax=Rhodonellum TaxID=336827 RepID=U5BXL5_9BACT|nr:MULTISPECIES: ATP-binding protein [Rhodonellum]ERM80667.1 hypothetical protein P872_12440 [Rhodonellum psychrophilum GCM71 = DSM 17998]SDZ32853.1 PAS domain S-box-containing protein [Rhodonellum ikkaensis]
MSTRFKIKFPPALLGGMVFMSVLILTQYFSYMQFETQIAFEKQLAKDQAILIQKQISSSLNYSQSATKILAFLEENIGIGDNFDSIAKDILTQTEGIDALQLVEGGVIKYVYPLNGNEPVIGYDILEQKKLIKEALIAKEIKTLYFAGPFELKQGGIGIVGRQPIFKSGEFWGFAAVIIHLDTFLKQAGIDKTADNPFYIGLSKINPETNIEEYFFNSSQESYEGGIVNLNLPEGDWNLIVQLKKSTAFRDILPLIGLRMILSCFLGYIVFNLAKQPEVLGKKVDEQSKQLKESIERFQFATKATSDAIWDRDFTTNKVYRSETFSKLFGHEVNELTSNDAFWQAHIHPEDLEWVNSKMNGFLSGTTEYWELEFRFRKKNGEYAFVVDKGLIIRNEKGEPIRVTGATQDITSRKTSEQALEKEKEFLRYMMENLSEGIIAADEKGDLILFNKAARNLHGLGEEEILTENWSNHYRLYHPDGKRLLKTEEIVLFKALNGEKIKDQEMMIAPKNLPKRIVLCSGEEIKTTDGRKLGAVVVMKDITDSRASEKALYQMSDQLIKRAKALESSNAELEQFAYVASHDLQEPLRMISSFLSILEKKYHPILDEKGKKYIHFAVDGAQRMRKIILDLLEYSRAGNVGNKEVIDTKLMVEDILLLERRLISQSNATIKISNLPKINASKAPLQQLFQNLIENALKYKREMESTEISIHGTEDRTHWIFSVTDNGLGIKKEFKEKIFTIFHRLHQKEEIQGSGIGLAICKKIVENHGGKIWVESEEGKGSSFYFNIAKNIETI